MSIRIDVPNFSQADNMLAKIGLEMRGPAIRKSLVAMGKVVSEEAKRRVVEGDRKHNPEAKPLKDTIGQVHRTRGNVQYVVVGALYPAGAHAHLVESGHRIVVNRGPNKGRDTGLRAVAKPFMAPAVDTTKSRQASEFVRVLDEEVQKANKKAAK